MKIGNEQTKHYLDTLYRKIWRSVTHKQSIIWINFTERYGDR